MANDLGNIFMPNILSPFDVSSIVENLVKLRETTLKAPVEQRKASVQEKLDAVGVLRGLVLDLLATSQNLSLKITYNVFKANLSNITGTTPPEDILGVQLGTDAVQSTFDVQVNQLAQSWKVASATFSSADDTLGSLGIATGDIILLKGRDTENAKVLRLDSSWTIRDLRDRINELNVGVTAYIVNTGSGVQLVLSASQTGASREYLTLADVNSNALQLLGFTDGIQTQKYSILQSDAFTARDVVVGGLVGLNPGEAPSGTVLINGVGVNIDLNTMTLDDIAAAINSAVGAGTASVVEENGMYRLQLNATSVDDNGTRVLETLGVVAQGFQNVVTAGQNAEISVDGTIYSSSDNTFTPDETGISGITFNAYRASTDVIRVEVQRNIDKILNYFNDFVDTWNSVIDFIREQTRFNPDTETSGPLAGDFVLLATESAMRRGFSGIVEVGQPDGTVKRYTIADLGFTFGEGGKLSFNSSKLRALLETDFESTVKALTSALTQKIASSTFASDTTALGITGEILVDGKSVVINSGDTLRDIALKINATVDSARAYIRDVPGGKQLVIESQTGGLANLVEVSGTPLVNLGLKNTNYEIKNLVNATTLNTDMFYSDTAVIRNSLDSDTTTQDTANNVSGNLIIPLSGGGSVTVNVDASTQSLQDIATNINNAAGSTIATVRSKIVGGETKYYIELTGVSTNPADWGGDDNVLQFLGILKKQENTIDVKSGFMEALRRSIDNLASPQGAIGATEDRYNTELTGIDQELEKIQVEVERYRAMLYERWGRANQLIARTMSIMRFLQVLNSAISQGIKNPLLPSAGNK